VLRAAKARATEAKARINNANQLISELADLNTRTPNGSAKIDSWHRSQDKRWWSLSM